MNFALRSICAICGKNVEGEKVVLKKSFKGRAIQFSTKKEN